MAFVALPARASDDKYWDKLWNIRKVGAESGWAVSKGRGITIAIVDTGVDLKHEDLKANLVPGYDFVDNDSVPMDDHGHGTHMAGIAAARVDNGLGVAGVAPEAKIMPVRVLDSDGSGYSDEIDRGIRWAADHGADVINLSLGADVLIEDLSGGTMADAANYAWSKGVIPVIATGNDNLFRTEFGDANAMMVTATTKDDQLAEYATGPGFAKWGIAAPGGSTYGGTSEAVLSSIWSNDGKAHYGYGVGTSMAVPHVSGAAAILRSLGFSPTETVGRLLATAKDLGSRGSDASYGRGRLDIAAAVAGMKPPATTKSQGTISPERSSPAPEPSPASGTTTRRETPKAIESQSTPRAEEEKNDPERSSEVRRAQGADQAGSDENENAFVAYLAVGIAVLAGGGAISLVRLRRS